VRFVATKTAEHLNLRARDYWMPLA
jgi:hypothetical protein